MADLTFGRYLRAARTGFHWITSKQIFVRVTPLTGDRWLVEACTVDGLPSVGRVDAFAAREHKPQAGSDFVCWWEHDPDGDRLLATCPALRELVTVGGGSWCAVLGDDGEAARG